MAISKHAEQDAKVRHSQLFLMSKVIIVGAGPAGLTAGWEAINAGHEVIILEQDPHYVGGISRTVEKEGYRFDIGGHRFFSKNSEIQAWWKERLSEDFLKVCRQSRIYFDQRFFSYPLELKNALRNLGLWRSSMCFLSYLRARLFPIKNEKSFEDWVINRFGTKLYQTFFKSYTEKVWGIECKDISKDWAAQRIKGLSLSKAIWHSVSPRKRKSGSIKTLIDQFHYPRHGPGQLWEETAEAIKQKDGSIEMGTKVVGLERSDTRILSITVEDTTRERRRVQGDHFLVSMPLAETILSISPEPPDSVIEAAKNLAYRDFLTVALVVKDENLFSDQWIYIHDPEVQVGRIQNYKNWSKEMVPDEGYTCLGLEYFCNESEDLWNSDDSQLIDLAIKECVQLGLTSAESVKKGFVVRAAKAYPVYDHKYIENIKIIKEYLDTIENLQVMGRNGMHKYNNQDHSMMTAILAVKNLEAQEVAVRNYDLWKVNTDAAYHEETEIEFSGGRDVPKKTKKL